MTPEQWGALADRFGLPLLMLGILIVGGLRGWVYFKPHVVALQERLDQMTALYERERSDRIEAQKIVAGFASANADVAEAVADLSRAVVKREPAPKRPRSPYAERLEGR